MRRQQVVAVGSAAAIAPTNGANPVAATLGFSQITRCARRRSRAMDAASAAGGSLSQPSDAITTTAPRRTPLCRDRSSASRFDAMRVPPKRSTTRALACSIATSTDRWVKTEVSRVSVVLNANTSASADNTAARMRCR